METWSKIKQFTEDGIIVPMQSPLIVSASRSTDIPNFYADWFFHRLEKGYSAWTNPFNGVKSYVSYKNIQFIVFLKQMTVSHDTRRRQFVRSLNRSFQKIANDF